MSGHVVRMIPGLIEGVAVIAGLLALCLWPGRGTKRKAAAVLCALLAALSAASIPWSKRYVEHQKPPLSRTAHTERRVVDVRLLPMSLVDPKLEGIYVDEGIRHWASPRGTGYDDEVVQFVITSPKGPHTLVERYAMHDIVTVGVRPEDARYEVWQCTYDDPEVAEEWGECGPRVRKLYVTADGIHLHDGRFENKPDVGRRDQIP